MGNEEAKRFPIDYEQAVAGDVIAASIIESFCGLPHTSHRYSGKQAELAIEVESELRSRNKPLIAVCDKADIRILTHEEAIDYSHRQFKKSMRRLYKNHYRHQQIDTRQLSEVHRRRHARQAVVQGAIVAGIEEVPEAIRLTSRRKNPGLESWPKPQFEA